VSPRHSSPAWFGAALAVLLLAASNAAQCAGSEPVNSLPNPYRTVENYFQLPPGRTWGQVPTVDIDSKGHIWVLDRCGGTGCVGSTLDPVLEFDVSGKLLKSFGSGMFVFPHGIFIDRNDNIWTTDGQGKDGKGQQVIKFNQDGKVLMRLGTAGVSGEGPDTFNKPSDVAIAPNGDIFVADGHGGEDSNARIVKFTKDGKFVKAWGKKGPGPGEFDAPHSLAFDSRGRLFVADRGNNRIQIFDQDGKLLDIWKQFSRPTGVFIDKHDTLYVADSDSDSERNPGWKRGIRIGSAKTGKVEFFIPYEGPDPKPGTNGPPAEGVAADAQGNVYGAEVAIRTLKMYVKK
jgi:sugar lactone lactonase YvrE